MKINFNRILGGSVLAFIALTGFSSCSDDFPVSVESDKFVELKSIRIVNAGAAGTEVLNGTIDESTKTINFPRLDTLTDFSSVRFEAETSEGAQLENDVVEIPFQTGDSQRDIILKVVNLPRFKEYKAVIRFDVPVYGADFSKETVYDYSANPVGNPSYAAFAGQLTRGSGFDGKHVLVVSRGTSGIHLLSVEDLKNNVVQPIPLKTTAGGAPVIEGGTYTHNVGAQVNGRTYVANLATSQAQAVRLYYWASPTAEPEVIANIDASTIAGAGARHGDNFSIGLDENGNGYAFFFSLGAEVLRLKIEDYKNVTETTAFSPQLTYGQWSFYNRIGSSENYLITSHERPISIGNLTGGVSYTMAAGSIPIHSGDPRIIEFNGERYLLVVTVPRGGAVAVNAVMRVYNITRGANIVDAFTAFEQSDKAHVYEFMISGNTNTAPGTQSGYHIVKDAQGKDEKLLLYGATTDAGFTIVEFPVNVAEED